MAEYTIVTNERREEGLTAAAARENKARAAKRPPLPPLTNAQYLSSVLVAAFDSYVEQAEAEKAQWAIAALKTASPSQKELVHATLGVMSPVAVVSDEPVSIVTEPEPPAASAVADSPNPTMLGRSWEWTKSFFR